MSQPWTEYRWTIWIINRIVSAWSLLFNTFAVYRCIMMYNDVITSLSLSLALSLSLFLSLSLSLSLALSLPLPPSLPLSLSISLSLSLSLSRSLSSVLNALSKSSAWGSRRYIVKCSWLIIIILILRNNIGVIIVASGTATRRASQIPKVLPQRFSSSGMVGKKRCRWFQGLEPKAAGTLRFCFLLYGGSLR